MPRSTGKGRAAAQGSVVLSGCAVGAVDLFVCSFGQARRRADRRQQSSITVLLLPGRGESQRGGGEMDESSPYTPPLPCSFFFFFQHSTAPLTSPAPPCSSPSPAPPFPPHRPFLCHLGKARAAAAVSQVKLPPAQPSPAPGTPSSLSASARRYHRIRNHSDERLDLTGLDWTGTLFFRCPPPIRQYPPPSQPPTSSASIGTTQLTPREDKTAGCCFTSPIPSFSLSSASPRLASSRIASHRKSLRLSRSLLSFPTRPVHIQLHMPGHPTKLP